MAEKSPAESRFADEGPPVPGIQKPGGKYIGVPVATTLIKTRDVLLLYGRGSAIQELDRRRRGLCGEAAHAGAKTRGGNTESGRAGCRCGLKKVFSSTLCG